MEQVVFPQSHILLILILKDVVSHILLLRSPYNSGNTVYYTVLFTCVGSFGSLMCAFTIGLVSTRYCRLPVLSAALV